MARDMQKCKKKMNVRQKTPAEVHRDLLASGIFDRETQLAIAKEIKVDQATVSRIFSGQFKRINKSVRRICEYADVTTVETASPEMLHSWMRSGATLNDPQKRKLLEIIGLAVELLERP